MDSPHSVNAAHHSRRIRITFECDHGFFRILSDVRDRVGDCFVVGIAGHSALCEHHTSQLFAFVLLVSHRAARSVTGVWIDSIHTTPFGAARSALVQMCGADPG